MKTTFKILLIEDNPDYIDLIQEMFFDINNDSSNESKFKLHSAQSYKEACNFLYKNDNDIDVILLDLFLPDSSGEETLNKFKDVVLETPVIVITQLDDDGTAHKALQEGMQDYILKDKLNQEVLLHTIKHSIDRHKMTELIRDLALRDGLTGLYNRRGFLTVAEYSIKLSKRKKQRITTIFIDLDCMKDINDKYGHKEGDAVLIETAKILKKSFRDSDLIARFGGDEFIVLAIDANNNHSLIKRLKKNTLLYNNTSQKEYNLSLSFGITSHSYKANLFVDDLIKEADELMYKYKKKKKEK